MIFVNPELATQILKLTYSYSSKKETHHLIEETPSSKTATMHSSPPTKERRQVTRTQPSTPSPPLRSQISTTTPRRTIRQQHRRPINLKRSRRPKKPTSSQIVFAKIKIDIDTCIKPSSAKHTEKGKKTNLQVGYKAHSRNLDTDYSLSQQSSSHSGHQA